MNKKMIVVTSIILVFIFIFGFVAGSVIVTKNAEKEIAAQIEVVNNIKNELNENKKALSGAQESIQTKADKIKELNTSLETANSIIAVLKSEEYVVGTTVTEAEIDMIAKTVWGEARGLNEFEQSMVVWCILNRVDNKKCSIAEIVTAPNQFHGYSKNHPVTDEIRTLVKDVIVRWKMEKVCNWNVGRTLPKEYLWFHGNGKHNYFRDAYSGNYNTWNCECWNPYN